MTSFPEDSKDSTAVLAAAAQASLLAPSVFNTQPWRWRIAGDTMELSADPARRLETTDPEGRLLLLSCGGALHHALTALAAAGWSAGTERIPDEGRPELLARVRLGQAVPPDPRAQALVDAMPRRRTDRRPFGDRTVPDAVLTELRLAVEGQGAYLHVVRPDQVPLLAISAARAADADLADPAYREELQQWTHRPEGSGDGVPPATAVEQALRRVPVRDFTPDGVPGLHAGDDVDRGAAYVVIFGMTDRPADLLRGGEAMSALLLGGTAEGLATAPFTEPVEAGWPRRLVQDLLSGIGEPYVVVRLGYVRSDEPLPAAPRREPADVITIEQ
jgi:nitroreductase